MPATVVAMLLARRLTRRVSPSLVCLRPDLQPFTTVLALILLVDVLLVPLKKPATVRRQVLSICSSSKCVSSLVTMSVVEMSRSILVSITSFSTRSDPVSARSPYPDYHHSEVVASNMDQVVAQLAFLRAENIIQYYMCTSVNCNALGMRNVESTPSPHLESRFRVLLSRSRCQELESQVSTSILPTALHSSRRMILTHLIRALLHPHLPLHLLHLLLLAKSQRPRNSQKQRAGAQHPQRLSTEAQSF